MIFASPRTNKCIGSIKTNLSIIWIIFIGLFLMRSPHLISGRKEDPRLIIKNDWPGDKSLGIMIPVIYFCLKNFYVIIALVLMVHRYRNVKGCDFSLS